MKGAAAGIVPTRWPPQRQRLTGTSGVSHRRPPRLRQREKTALETVTTSLAYVARQSLPVNRSLGYPASRQACPVPSCRTQLAGMTIRSLAAMWMSQMFRQTHCVIRGRAKSAPRNGNGRVDHRLRTAGHRNRRTGRQREVCDHSGRGFHHRRNNPGGRGHFGHSPQGDRPAEPGRHADRDLAERGPARQSGHRLQHGGSKCRQLHWEAGILGTLVVDGC